MDKEENAPCPRDQPELEGFGTNPLWNLPPQENRTAGAVGREFTDPGGSSRKRLGKGFLQDPLAEGTAWGLPSWVSLAQP